jgi:hypothetical protein
MQRPNEQVGKIGDDDRWFFSYPRHRNARQCHEIPEHPSEIKNVRIRVGRHLSGCSPLRRDQSTLSQLEKEFLWWNEEWILPE